MLCETCKVPLPDGARFCSSCGSPVSAIPPANADPLRDLLEKTLSPHIEIIRPIGRGGMGAVYLGRERALEREVAVKALRLDLDDGESRERFRREARIAAKLNHSHIVPLYSFGETENIIYYVMGFVRGESLAERLARDPSIPIDAAQRILAELTDAVGYAHEHGIVHRDLKPENVLVDDATGNAILTDFGIARHVGIAAQPLTRVGAVVGTPHYMSPEQAMGKEVDFRSDLYSLGVLGYRMLSGKTPIRADSFSDIVAQHARDDAPRIEPLGDDVPTLLASAIMRCLRKDPIERWSSARELRDVLSPARSPSELLDELHQIESHGFYLIPPILLAVLLSAFEIFVWDEVDPLMRIVILLTQLAPALWLLAVIQRAAESGKGVSTRSIVKLIVRAPRWYEGWVPRAMRRDDDLWERLPSIMRHVRILHTAIALFAVTMPFVLPFAVMFAGDRRFVWAMRGYAAAVATLCALLIAAIVRLQLLLKRNGLSAAERSRLMLRSALWRDPRMKKLLLPEAPTAEPAIRPYVGDQDVTTPMTR